MRERVFRIVAEGGGGRLDVFVARHCPGLSRSQAQRLIREGKVTLNGLPARQSSLVIEHGDRVEARVPPSQPVEAEPQALPLNIVYEDADIIVVDKPAGMAVHPGAGRARDTLVNALLAHSPGLSGIGGRLRPGIVHRLDKDTSGLLLVAKNDLVHEALSRQLKERQVEKVYLALVKGNVEPSEGVIEGAIGRDPRNRKRMAIVAGGREAVTRYRTRETVEGCTLLEVMPSTGRTHQIRVHLAAIGHPVVGDAVYGRPSPLVGRQFLHAYRLGFRHPADGRRVRFESPLPDDLEQALRLARAAPSRAS